MHSIFARINNLSAFLSSFVMALLGAIALSSFLFNPDVKGDIGIVSVKVCVLLYLAYLNSQADRYRCISKGIQQILGDTPTITKNSRLLTLTSALVRLTRLTCGTITNADILAYSIFVHCRFDATVQLEHETVVLVFGSRLQQRRGSACLHSIPRSSSVLWPHDDIS